MSSNRIGGWIQTFTNKAFYPLDPRPEDVCIEDIAHSLSNMCRFTGHVKEFYSVAEHSVRASWIVDQRIPALVLATLMHDAAEAYLVDVARPIKSSLIGYAEIEEKVHQAICKKVGIDPVLAHSLAVKKVDNIMLATEKRDLMGSPPPLPWNLEEEPHADPIIPWSPQVAEAAFLARFQEPV